MVAFWILAIITLVLVVGIIIISMIRVSRAEPENSQENDSTLYRQRLDELQSDLENGVITEHEAELSQKEIQLSYINKPKDDVAEPQAAKISSLNKFCAAGVAVFVPVFVLSLYLYLGRPDLINVDPGQLAEQQPVTMEQIEQMLGGLEQRLQQQPDDVEGWQMFYKSNMVLERYDKALLAAEQLYQLQGEQPDALLRYADALAMANQGQLNGQPQELIQKALQMEPDNPNGLWLAGLAANQNEDWSAAIEYWERLIQLVDENDEPVQQLKQMIAEVKSRQQADSEPATDAKQLNITLDVSLTPEFASQVEDGDALYVFARLANGPAMPIAVVRRNATELPLQVTLDDSVSMLPTEKTVALSTLEVTARISKDGNVKAGPGDMYGNITVADATASEPLELIINKQIE